MTKFLRMAALAALTLSTTTPALAATQPDKQANASVVIKKPLTLVWVQDLDLGDITIVDGAVSSTVGLTWDGVWSCPTAGVTCGAPHQVAKYKVTGVNNTSVTINAGNISLKNQSDLTKTLLLTVSSPGTVALGNSGSSGTEFALGGSVTVNGATVDGTYQGTFAVTVNY
jgi:hypothetical protein